MNSQETFSKVNKLIDSEKKFKWKFLENNLIEILKIILFRQVEV